MGAAACSSSRSRNSKYNIGKKLLKKGIAENDNLQEKVTVLILSGTNFVIAFETLDQTRKKEMMLKIIKKIKKICDILKEENIVKILNEAEKNHKTNFENKVFLFELQERFYNLHEVLEKLEI